MTLMPLLCFLVISALVLVLVGRPLSHLSRKRESRVLSILALTSTNNTYPPLLDVLSNLDGDLERLDEKLHADMQGYMNYDQDES